MSPTGGPPLTICPVTDGRGGTWSPRGVIVFAPGIRVPLHRVNASGGIPERATALGPKDYTHRWPRFLPDGVHFLYLSLSDDAARAGIRVASLDTSEDTFVVATRGKAEYDAGRLLYVRENALYSQPFDAGRRRLSGEPGLVVDGIVVEGDSGWTGLAAFSAGDGTLVYRRRANPRQKLTWFDRSGKVLGTVGDASVLSEPFWIAAGQRLGVSVTDRRTELPDLWQVDLARGAWTRLTFGPKANNTGIASPDGKFLYFSSNRQERMGLFRRPLDGSGGDEALLSTTLDNYGDFITPDGASLVYEAPGAGGRPQLWRLPLSGERKPSPLLAMPAGGDRPFVGVARRKVLRVFLGRDGPRGGVRAEVSAVGREVADLDGRRRPGTLARGRKGAVFPLERPQAHVRRDLSRGRRAGGSPGGSLSGARPGQRDLRQPLPVHSGSGRKPVPRACDRGRPAGSARRGRPELACDGSRPSMRRRLAVSVLVAALAGPSLAQGLPPAPPAAAGVAPERLARLDAAFREAVADRKIAGAVVYVARGGRTVDFEAVGWQDVEKKIPMRRDAIFRIASMSKAVTTVAALVLLEEGRLTLDAPVSRYVPAFAKTTVLVPPPKDASPGAPPRIEAARRPITIRDLMTHTAGISYGTGALEERYRAANAYWWYLADKDETIASFVDRLATLPFEAQPGERFVYGFSTDVLGRVVEVVSGRSLDAFFEERIFRPLRMPDTSFFLPSEKRARLATVYGLAENGKIERAPEKGWAGQGAYVDGPRRCFSGGGGLLSTAADFGRFLQMLLNGGELDGVRLLSPKTVELATANLVGTLYDDGLLGFGLGFEVTEKVGPAGRLDSPGAFGWGSAYYPRYFVDPKEHLVAFFLTQLIPARDYDLHRRFRTLVYQSIVGGLP